MKRLFSGGNIEQLAVNVTIQCSAKTQQSVNVICLDTIQSIAEWFEYFPEQLKMISKDLTCSTDKSLAGKCTDTYCSFIAII